MRVLTLPSIILAIVLLPLAEASSPSRLVFEFYNPAPTTPPPQTTLAFADPKEALKDPENRVSKGFEIPETLQQRVGFWFDIYTKYSSSQYVIHHVRYPWIVFGVIDGTEMIETGKGPKWLRIERVEKLVKRERQTIEQALVKMSRRKSFDNLTGIEARLYSTLDPVLGHRAKVFKEAARNLRVQLGQKDFFIEGLKSSTQYLPYMEEIFLARNLPLELTRLPLVESSFNVKAHSKLGASGVWQVMPSIGRHYLILDDTIDERRSPLKATLVAAKILKQNFNHFDSWPLAVTAYNHGIGSLNRAVKATGTKDLSRIIEKYYGRSFKFASSNFYCSYLAALHAEKYHNEIFVDSDLQKKALIVRDVLRLKTHMKVATVLKYANIDLETLISFNLDLKKGLRKNDVLPKGYQIHLPSGAKGLFLENLAARKKPSRQA